MVMLDAQPTTRVKAAQATVNQASESAPENDETATGLVWESVEGVQPAAWVGRVRGIFVGMVEARWQEGYTSTTRLGRKLGTFGTLDAAQDAFIVKNAPRPADARRR
jgi:hypothetical protein